MMGKNCCCCDRETIIDGYLLRVTNPNGDTLFVTACIVEAINFMEGGAFSSVSCYRIEVMRDGAQ